ncbi:MAG: 1-acyl-sn-glycerol-3-phosphate acyltransferase [Lewinellaceae bacterium]|nr:1-acyl-sn-glycerol-3-phosphate acyltransferase [Lewinellaceae bacterium]
MNNLRALYRLFYFALYTLYKSAQIVVSNLVLGTDARRSIRIRQSWARTLLPHLGVRVHILGTPPEFPCIVACNHRSYLDPPLMAHNINGYGVAKAEVANWPVIGWGARVAGVLFLRRESQQSRKTTLQGIADKVKEGYPIILFVEGTTHAGPTTLDFKPGAFKLAAQQDIAIVPAALEFASPDDYWVGDDTFLPHLWRRLQTRYKDAYVSYGPVLRNSDADALLRDAKNWIDAELLRLQKGFGRGL